MLVKQRWGHAEISPEFGVHFLFCWRHGGNFGGRSSNLGWQTFAVLLARFLFLAPVSQTGCVLLLGRPASPASSFWFPFELPRSSDGAKPILTPILEDQVRTPISGRPMQTHFFPFGFPLDILRSPVRRPGGSTTSAPHAEAPRASAGAAEPSALGAAGAADGGGELPAPRLGPPGPGRRGPGGADTGLVDLELFGIGPT